MTARIATHARYAPENRRDAAPDDQRGIHRVRAGRWTGAPGGSLMRSGMAAALGDRLAGSQKKEQGSSFPCPPDLAP